jgi:hypothetical protein
MYLSTCTRVLNLVPIIFEYCDLVVLQYFSRLVVLNLVLNLVVRVLVLKSEYLSREVRRTVVLNLVQLYRCTPGPRRCAGGAIDGQRAPAPATQHTRTLS